MVARIAINQNQVSEFCRRWKICELAFFGSVLRDDFRPDSDVDVLASFDADAKWGLLQHAQMREELSVLLGHPVDLVTRRAVESSDNWIRKRAILESAEVVHVAR
jgi:predicted nucleotidyltransferase